MSTPVDFHAINEIFENRKLPPVDEAFLPVLLERLRSLGLEASITEAGVVRADLTRHGHTYAVGMFASARQVFHSSEDIVRQCQRRSLIDVMNYKLREQQSQWFESEPRGVDRYLYIVKPDDFTIPPGLAGVALDAELDCYCALKTVCSLDELASRMLSPFADVARRANDEPVLHCGRASRSEFETSFDYAALATLPFRPEQFAQLVAQVGRRRDPAAVRALAATLLRRILGSDYRVVDGDAWPELARGDNDWSLPPYMLGHGELVALSFALFLALAYEQVQAGQGQGMCVGVSESLNALDLVRQFNALDLLRDFVAATGASVCFQTDKSDIRGLVERKVKHGQDIAKQAAQLPQ